MKIIFIVGSLSKGGAERVASEIANSMSKQHDIYYMVIGSTEKRYFLSENVNFIDCSKKNNCIRGFSFIARIKMMKTYIRNIKPDVCVSFTTAVNIYSILSSLSRDYKLIIAERNDPNFDPQNKIIRLMRKLFYRFSDFYVFQTENEKKYFSKKIQEKSVIIPNPIDPNIPSPYTDAPKKKFVMSVRLSPQKNIKMAIDAFEIFDKIHSNYILEIYGHGELFDELNKYILNKKLEDKVFLRGPSKDIYSKIQDATALLLSSDYEGISNSMLEAMALGVVTISTDYPSGGASLVIEDGINGFLVPVNDSKKMAEKMSIIVEKKYIEKQIRCNSILVRDKYNVRKINKEWNDFIEEII